MIFFFFAIDFSILGLKALQLHWEGLSRLQHSQTLTALEFIGDLIVLMLQEQLDSIPAFAIGIQ